MKLKTMTDLQDVLINDIVYDSEVKNACNDLLNLYNKIASVQTSSERKQVPEPFNGNLMMSRILFIGSNPSISDTEIYPDYSWKLALVIDFFKHRFDKYADHYTRYWDYVVKFSNWISECLNWNVQFLKHNNGCLYRDLYPYVAITEIVRCKSKHEYGVKECMQYSYDKWMKRTLSLFNGEVVVLVGRKVWNFENDIRNALVDLKKPKIKIVKIEHPSAHIKGLTDIKRMSDLKAQLVTM